MIRCRLSCLRMAATRCLTHWRAMSGRGRFCWSRVMNWTKCLPPKAWPEPVAVLAFAARHDRLVHQVVAEDGRALGATARHGLPEAGLHVPAVLLGELVVPGRHVRLVVAAQAGQVEVEPFLLGQADELRRAGPGPSRWACRRRP